MDVISSQRSIVEAITKNYTIIVHVAADGMTKWYCKAKPGSLNDTALPIWQVRRIRYTTVGGEKEFQDMAWMNGSDKPDQIADNYTAGGTTYS
jgi:hypothetical protein